MSLNENLKKGKVVKGFIATAIISVVLIGVGFFYTIPSMKLVASNKQQLKKEVETYKQYEKNGLSLSEYMSLSQKEENVRIVSEDTGVLEEVFLNTGNMNYMDFLKTKEAEINEDKKEGTTQEKYERIAKIIPSYTDGFDLEGNMTDLSFINYIEKILRTFSLKTDSKIGIESLNLIEDSQEQQNISSEMFYIPLSLDLVGKKSDIIQFIHFIEKVGVASLDAKENFLFHNDQVLRGRVLAGEKLTPGYNIYQNYMIDIDSIEMPEYIDSSNDTRGLGETAKTAESFIDFISNGTQRDFEYHISVDLKFYVRGLPTYKIEMFIEQVLSDYDELLGTIRREKTQLGGKSLMEKGKRQQKIAILRSLENFLIEKESNILKLRNQLNQQGDLTSAYKEASDIYYELGNLKNYITSSN